MRKLIRNGLLYLFFGALFAVGVGCGGDDGGGGSSDGDGPTISDIEEALEDVPSGEGNDQAADYKSQNPSPSVAIQTTGFFLSTFDLPSSTRPDSLEETEVVIANSEVWTEIERGTYTGGQMIIRKRHDVSVRVMEAKTGNTIASKSFKGGNPDPLPKTYTFSSFQRTVTFRGEEVSEGTVLNWLNRYIVR